jgi:hypothetical protein
MFHHYYCKIESARTGDVEHYTIIHKKDDKVLLSLPISEQWALSICTELNVAYQEGKCAGAKEQCEIVKHNIFRV